MYNELQKIFTCIPLSRCNYYSVKFMHSFLIFTYTDYPGVVSKVFYILTFFSEFYWKKYIIIIIFYLRMSEHISLSFLVYQPNI